MNGRVVAAGKFLRLDGETFTVRGVTYGSFGARGDGVLFPEPGRIHTDFAQMAALGVNTVRLYAAPSPDLLDAAGEHGLRLIIGTHYEDWRYQAHTGKAVHQAVVDAGRRSLDQALEVCAGRPEVLAWSVGNEVPSDLVRVHGVAAVEDVLSELVAQVRRADPHTLATYTNFPSTEYLQVEGQTLATFNVFLEEREAFRRYLRHLQTATGPLPLVITELGLAAGAHGVQRQAEVLRWQLE